MPGKSFNQQALGRLLWLALTAPLLGGCTFENGQGFATLESASLGARFAPGVARDLGGGAVLTSQNYSVRLAAFALGVDQISLEELRGGSGGSAASFDEARPPPGYSLCHNGHCHADDGRLVDYAEVEAELAGSNARFEPVATLPFAGNLDLLAGQSVVLDQVMPSRELPQASVSKLRALVTLLKLEATLSGGPATGGIGEASVPFAVELPLLEPLATGFALTIDRDQPGAFRLEVEIVVDATLFDAIDFSAHVAGGRIDVTSAEHALAPALVAALLESEIHVRSTSTD